MGNALVVVKVYPEGPDEVAQVEAGVKALKSGAVKETRREPIAFGLELIKAGIVIPDKTDGIMEKLEEEIKAIPGVKDLEVEGVTLL